jgi:hypothetical protein
MLCPEVYYVLGKGQAQDVTCEMRAEPTVVPGSVARLVLEPRTPFARCYDMQRVEFTLPIE